MRVTTLVVALTRLAAISASMWDWDEALFCAALRDYDVVQHRPHPPGYPLFIALGHITRLVATSDFRALQALNVIASMTLFPLVYLIARELRFSFRTAYFGALLFVFFPNVWFYGGTAYSETAALAVAFAGIFFLLRGRVSGAFVLALAAAIRPQLVLLGLIPLFRGGQTPSSVLAPRGQARRLSSTEMRKRPFLMFGIFLLVTIGAYAGAAVASESVDGYIRALRNQETYFRTVDSFMNPERESLGTLANRFLFEAIPGAGRATAVAVFAIIGLISALAGRRWNVLMLLAIFLPHAIVSWLLFDQGAVARYTVPHVAMHAILAAEGIGVVALLFRRHAVYVQTILVLALIGTLVIWTVPALRVVMTSDAPSVAAMKLIRDTVPPDQRVYAFHGFVPFTNYYLTGRDIVHVRSASEVPADAVYVTEGLLSGSNVQTFERERNPLTRIARRRYFTVSVRIPAGEPAK